MRTMWFTGLAMVGVAAVVTGAAYGAVVYRNHEASVKAIAPVLLQTWQPTYGVKAGGRDKAAVVRLLKFVAALNVDVSDALTDSELRKLQSPSKKIAQNAWKSYRANIRPGLYEDIARAERNLAPAQPYLQDPNGLANDLRNMQLLLELADFHQDATGVKALTLCRQAAQDLQYYLLGKGSCTGVTEVQGSRQVDDFLLPYEKELQ